MILKVFMIAMTKVLVLIPPPVETGEAPTHIKKMVMITEGIERIDIAQLLKPAVRGVIL